MRTAALTEIVAKPSLDVKVVRRKCKKWFNYSITWPCLICCRRKLFPVVKFTLILEHSRYINHKTINVGSGKRKGATLNRKSTIVRTISFQIRHFFIVAWRSNFCGQLYEVSAHHVACDVVAKQSAIKIQLATCIRFVWRLKRFEIAQLMIMDWTWFWQKTRNFDNVLKLLNSVKVNFCFWKTCRLF